MSRIVRVVGAADGSSTPHDGRYVVEILICHDCMMNPQTALAQVWDAAASAKGEPT